MKIQIDRAAADESVALTALAHRAKAAWGYPPEWIAKWRADLTLSADYIRAHRVFVARGDGQLAGVCALEDHATFWLLEHLWVEPARQRAGIGRALVLHALHAMRRVRPGVLAIISDPYAAGFYERLGARPAGSVPAPMPGAPDRYLPKYEIVVDAAR